MAVQANAYYTMRLQKDRTRDPHVLTGIRNAAVIYNPAAGSAREKRRRALEEARKILKESGIEAELWATTGPGAATGLARRAVEEQRELVIVAGGDGTINEAVNGLAGSPVPLAVLPAGTANVLGKELRLPWNIPAATRLIVRGTLRRIALGVALRPGAPERKRYFMCVAGAGPDGMMVYATSLAVKARFGILAYWLEGFRQAFLYKFPAFRVVSEGTEHTATTAIVGRTKHYGGPVQITTQADLLQDSFEVMISTSRSRFRQIGSLPALLAGRHRRLKHVRFWKTTAVRCEPLGDERVYAQVDGEGIGTLPVEFRVVPDGLTLVVPPSATDLGAGS